MQITIACHHCNKDKRPLTPCPACQAPPLAELELQAWRFSLHTLHMARLERTPRAGEVVPSRRPRMTPLRAVVTVDLDGGARRAPARAPSQGPWGRSENSVDSSLTRGIVLH
jgi:hypothetical protein